MDTTARRVVEALVEASLLDPALRDPSLDVVARALAPVPVGRHPARPALPSRSGIAQVVEVVAYLGGALVLAAGALLMSEAWTTLDHAGQVALLAVTAAVLALAGGAVALTERGIARRQPEHDARRRLAGSLVTAAAGCAGAVAALVLDRGPGRRTAAWTWSCSSPPWSR